MGRTYRRYDRDEEYHDVRWEKENNSQLREKRHHRREIEEPVVEQNTYKKSHSKNRTHTMFDFYKGK